MNGTIARWALMVLLGTLLASAPSAMCAHTQPAQGPVHWPPAVFNTPAFSDAPGFSAEGVKPLYYEGLAYRGKPTRVFAWYGVPKLEAGKKAPGIVLVHGGGGTAFDAWVRLWIARGYAAIAMDNVDRVPPGSPGSAAGNPQGGPMGWGGLDQIDKPVTDQWTYHAVADVVLADSLLRSMPDVDPDRIGITGISWGGYLTCIAAGVDHRFRFAVPVYGCGFLGEDSVWTNDLKALGPDRCARWLSLWDPSAYLKDAPMPMLWVDGTNDFAYPLDSLQKSYRLPTGPRWLCMKVRMPHGHGGPGENPEEIHALADSIVNGGKPLSRITSQGRNDQHVWAKVDSAASIVRAELNYTKDQGPWQKRTWETIPATVDQPGSTVSANLPTGVHVYYLSLIDQRGLYVSTDHEELK